VDDDTLLASGLAMRARTGNLIDVFRDRLMLPLRSDDGAVVAFIGRAHPDASSRTPRYLNSITTALFTKSEHVFGLAQGGQLLKRGALPVLGDRASGSAACAANTQLDRPDSSAWGAVMARQSSARTTDMGRGTWIDRGIDHAVTFGVAILVLVGFATSYRTLRDLAVSIGRYPPWLAPAVPLSFDLGVIVLSLKVAQAAREGRHAPVLRLLVAGLSAATVLANASAVPGTSARLLHAVPPAMFVVCFESVVITARRRALQARGVLPKPLPKQQPLLWLLAPRRAWLAWRTSVLGQVSIPVTMQHSGPGRRQQDREREAEVPERLGELKGALPRTDSGLDRLSLVVAKLTADGMIPAPALRSVLAKHGHVVSLRTAQRLRAAALTHANTSRPDPGESRRGVGSRQGVHNPRTDC
jgi:hypothetical protein